MTSYTIANIPTLYRGRMYRSRLEARWAAFFDRLGWTHEYEPFDLGSWSPDFAITEPFDALVEVKPATEYDEATAQKMVDAAGADASLLLLTRVCPLPGTKAGHRIGWIGWFEDEVWKFRDARLVWRPHGHQPGMYADLCWVEGGNAYNGTGADAWQVGDGWRFYREHVETIWADATNAVQWEPER